jgi:FKBP-type peptidyl-prolyl cis-trans isomerase
MASCEGCGKPAKMQCPTCRTCGIEQPSRFCDQACFKANWNTHKAKHAESPLMTGEAFLKAKATEEGVKRHQSGMLFKQLSPGEGKKSPKLNDTCQVHYRGTLVNGTEFDSSYARGEPATFKPSQVIQGWTIALQRMCEGEKWEVYLPHTIAYGENGSPPEIPGYSTLVFTIELLKVMGEGVPYETAAAKLKTEITQ